MASLYVLEQCDFVSHLNPRAPDCVQTARSLRMGATSAAAELVRRGPPRTLRERLDRYSAQVVLLPSKIQDFTTEQVDALDEHITDAREGARRWGRRTINHWLGRE